MTSDEIRAVEVPSPVYSDSALIALLLREIAAQLAMINSHLEVVTDTEQGITVQVDAKYDEGLLVIAKPAQENV